MGGSSKKQTIGYKYYLGIHVILGHATFDFIKRIRFDKKTAWRGAKDSGQITINKPELFGGERREGGVSGVIDIEAGGPDQTENTYLQSQLGSNIPGYRGVVGAVFNQFYFGNNPYLKRFDFFAQRINKRTDGTAQWNVSKAPIGHIPDQPVALFFALDFSGSMAEITSNGETRFDNMREGMYAVFDTLDVLFTAQNLPVVDIQLHGFTNGGSILRRDVDSADLAALTTWLEGGTASGSTDWVTGVEDADTFFAGGPSGARKILFLITDGTPDPPEQTTTDNTIAELTGISDLEIYTVNIDDDDVTYTSQVDNTEVDDVPVISGGDPTALTSIIMDVLSTNLDLNPAHVIRECLIDQSWGMGYLESDIDDTSFLAAADTLLGESLGVSLIWDRQTSIESFIFEVIKHIDGALYVDRTTGKFVLKLIRDDYDEGTLIELDESNVDRVEDFSRPAFGELTNSVSVNYWDAETLENASVTVQDTAMVQMQQAVINTTASYSGITNSTLASRIAARDLLTLSSSLWSGVIYTGRVVEDLTIGDVFKFSWSDYGISELVMRITGISYGDGKSNKIRLQVTQDAFSIKNVATVTPPDPDDGWTPPDTTAAAAPVRIAQETPYLEIVRELGQTDIDAKLTDNNALGYLSVGAGRPSNAGAINAGLYVDSGGGYVDSGIVDFAPYAYLDGDITKGQTVIPIKNGVDLDLVEVGQFGQFGSEIFVVDAISSSSMTIGRGALDTVPALHLDDDAILFWDNYEASDETEYVASDMVDVKLLTITGTDVLDISAAPVDSVTFATRAFRPYPPGKVQLNGSYFPDFIDGESNLTITWTHRDRIQQTSETLLDFFDDSVGPETDVTYELSIYDENDALLRTETGLTGVSYAYTAELEDVGSGNGSFEDYVIANYAPAGYWNFDEDSGSSAADSVGSNTATYNSVTLQDDPLFISDTYSFGLNGSTSYVDWSTTDFQFGTGNFTLGIWISTSAAANQAIFDSRTASEGILLGISSSGAILFQAFTSASADTHTTSATGFNDGEPHFIAVTVNQSSGEVYIYVDGAEELMGSIVNATNISGTSTPRLGDNTVASSYGNFTGSISDFFYTNDEMLVDEILDIFGVGSTAGNTYFDETVLLLNGNGSDGSTTFTDSSNSAHTVSRLGNVQIDTADQKYGTGSILFDGTPSGVGEHLTVPWSSDFDFGSGDFTIEAWMKAVSLPSSNINLLCSTGQNSSPLFYGLRCGVVDDGSMKFLYSTNGSTANLITGSAGAFTTDTWHHVAFVRYGSTIYLWIDGELNGSGAISGSIYANSEVLQIGTGYDTNGSINGRPYWDGWMDDIRFTKGIARYIHPFTPPTAELGEFVSGRRNGRLRFTLKAVRDSLDSFQQHDITVRREGYGFNYGMNYGGTV